MSQNQDGIHPFHVPDTASLGLLVWHPKESAGPCYSVRVPYRGVVQRHKMKIFRLHWRIEDFGSYPCTYIKINAAGLCSFSTAECAYNILPAMLEERIRRQHLQETLGQRNLIPGSKVVTG